MTKTFPLFILLVLISLYGRAQISLDSGDMPQAGANYRFSIPDSTFAVDLSQTGPNSNWDFSTLVPMFQNVDSFLNPSSLPFIYTLSFPTADIAKIQNAPDSAFGPVGFGDSYTFYRNTSDAYENLGLAGEVSLAPIPLALVNNPVDTIYRFPVAYGDVDSSFSVAELNLAVFGLYVRREQKRVNQVDGWGSISTPYGTFDVLRIRSEITGFDTIFVDMLIDLGIDRFPTREYRWVTKTEGIPILQVNTTAFGAQEFLGGIQYKDSVRNVPTVGIGPEIEALNARMYPNPATDALWVDLDTQYGADAVIRIFDLNGRLLREIPLGGRSRIQIDISGFKPGLYPVEAESGGKRYQGKLLIR